MKEEKVGILGYGEIGQAIGKFYKFFFIKDLDRDTFPKKLDILHICIPIFKGFEKVIKDDISSYDPYMVIIHSTVPVGTTKKIQKSFPRKIIAQSPARGVHPYLYEGIKTFVKYVGVVDKKRGEIVKKHLNKIGIKKVKVLTPPETSEALKLWDTTQYGWFIVLNKAIKKWCDKKGLDFETIYTEANKSYNEGYLKLGRPEVVRPRLKYMSGFIGGHCVIPNCYLLDDEIAKFILKKNEIYKKEK